MSNPINRSLLDNTAFQAFLAQIEHYGYVDVTGLGRVEIYRARKHAPPNVGSFLGFRVRAPGLGTVAENELELTLAEFDAAISYAGEPPTLTERITDAEAAIDTLDGRADALEATSADHETRIQALEGEVFP
jgi:hypothetical protein